MLFYLLKSSACLLAFYLFYRVVLEKESLHHTKRFYLMAALLLSFCIPLITFSEYVQVDYPLTQNASFIDESGAVLPSSNKTFDWDRVAWGIYMIGLALFGTKFLYNLFEVIFRIKHNPTLKKGSLFHVLIQKDIVPHTFFNYLFFNYDEYEENRIPKEVFLHEEAHAHQKHSLDIIFIELLQVLFWFNPLLFLYKRNIKLNHEFLADNAVLKQGIETSTYQNLILHYSSSTHGSTMTHAFNYSSTRLTNLFFINHFGQVKKRFTLMKTQTSKRSIWIKSFLILPLVSILLYSFSERVTIARETKYPPKQLIDDKVEHYNLLARHYANDIAFYSKYPNEKEYSELLSNYKNLEDLYHNFTEEEINALEIAAPKQPPLRQKEKLIENNVQGASKKELSEYDTLARKYNAQSEKNRFYIKKEVERMKYIFSIMTKEQRRVAEPFPTLAPMPDPPPPPPPAPSAPKVNFETPKAVSPAPPPSPPPSPEEHLKEMGAKGAKFYFEGKEIYLMDALKLLRTQKKIHISSKETDTLTPMVFLSIKPLTPDDC
ncbi:M56 family metallopeptidase [Sungkyunkwania multivorans]|uniref:M56 family metallopeptidase n=1 Tax=Sungkyunkwania multivorans TaxID=1173618 RepID=A0ABW3D222_9FLAO